MQFLWCLFPVVVLLSTSTNNAQAQIVLEPVEGSGNDFEVKAFDPPEFVDSYCTDERGLYHLPHVRHGSSYCCRRHSMWPVVGKYAPGEFDPETTDCIVTVDLDLKSENTIEISSSPPVDAPTTNLPCYHGAELGCFQLLLSKHEKFCSLLFISPVGHAGEIQFSSKY
jgi:hypothetical protein